MMDYSKYILDYEKENKKLPSRQRVLRFLNYVQIKNVPVYDWINTFDEHQDLFLDKLSPKSKSVYRKNILRFLEYTRKNFHGKQQSIIQASGGLPKNDRVMKNKSEHIGKLKLNKPKEKKKNNSPHEQHRNKTTQIVSDWRKL